MNITWNGVIPAITTPFNADLSIDHGFFAEHCRWLIDAGCVGIVPHGSLGEGATLTFEEKVALVDSVVKAVGDRAAIIPWFLPLLRLDTLPKFVQLIKLAQDLVGMGGARVRPPRLELAGAELEQARRVIQQAIETRPSAIADRRL